MAAVYQLGIFVYHMERRLWIESFETCPISRLSGEHVGWLQG